MNAGGIPRFTLPRNNGFINGRPAYRSGSARPDRAFHRRGDGDRFRQRRRDFENWRANVYPVWLGYGYPYTLDPGFVDWGDNGDATADNSAAAYPEPASPDPDYPNADQGTPPPAYPLSYPGEIPGEVPGEAENGAHRRQYTGAGSNSPPASGEPLTLIFKDGRDPVKIANYMMTATVLTDLDPQHYEKIPLDQIDVAATQRANTAAGVDFQVPASGN
jgi:hypothetical protein